MFGNHEENTMSISYVMVDLGNGFTKIASMAKKFGVLTKKDEENSILRTYVSKKFMKARHFNVDNQNCLFCEVVKM
jgi:Asp/Glu/hydantoin racemase